MKERSRPGPLRYDRCGSQTDANFAARIEGRVQVVGIMVDVLSDLRAESEVSLSEI